MLPAAQPLHQWIHLHAEPLAHHRKRDLLIRHHTLSRGLQDYIRLLKNHLVGNDSDQACIYTVIQALLLTLLILYSAGDMETDEATLMRRQKNIDYGKADDSYKLYLSAIPK